MGMSRATTLWVLVGVVWLACHGTSAMAAGNTVVVSPTTPGGLVGAVKAVSAGDTIVLLPGVFSGATHCGGHLQARNVTVAGKGTSATLLNCTGSGLRGLLITASGATLTGFTVQGGHHASEGGNVYVANYGPTGSPFSVTLQGMHIVSGSVGNATASFASGGGMAITDVTHVTLNSVTFVRNRALGANAEGGGVAVRTRSPSAAAVVNVSLCKFEDNTAVCDVQTGADGGSAQAGAMRVFALDTPQLTFSVTSSAFVSNSVSCSPNCNAFAGALAAVGNDIAFGSVNNSLSVSSSTFFRNSASASECQSLGGCGAVGGAINSLMDTRIDGSVFTSSSVTCACNTSATNSSQACSASGGAIFAQGAPFTASQSRFATNSATCTGVHCAAGGGAVSIISAPPTVVDKCTLEENTASCSGYACQAMGAALGVLNYAGGVPAVNMSVKVTGATFASNAVTSSRPFDGDAGYTVYGSLGGSIFTQNINYPSNTTLHTSLAIADSSFSDSTVSCTGPKCRAGGGVGFALTYSGSSSLETSGSSFVGANASCVGDSCLAGNPLFSGVASGTVQGLVMNCGEPSLFSSTALYTDTLSAPNITMPSAILTCPFLDSMSWTGSSLCPSSFNSTCSSTTTTTTC